MAMYIEHRFVNLIWGLEAFHRKKGGGSTAVAAKVNRILDRIDDGNDKRWLAKRLEHAHEPSLEQRLFEVFKALPLGLDEKRFARILPSMCKIAQRHFAFRWRATRCRLFRISEGRQALSVLYHALLLHEAGIDEQILKRWAFHSFLSAPIRIHFVQAGLLDKTALRAER